MNLPRPLPYEATCFLCPTKQHASMLVVVVESAAKLSRFAHYSHGAQSLAPARQNDTTQQFPCTSEGNTPCTSEGNLACTSECSPGWPRPFYDNAFACIRSSNSASRSSALDLKSGTETPCRCSKRGQNQHAASAC